VTTHSLVKCFIPVSVLEHELLVETEDEAGYCVWVNKLGDKAPLGMGVSQKYPEVLGRALEYHWRGLKV